MNILLNNKSVCNAEAAWPEWLEHKRVEDELSACAYETFSPACRGAIKTGLAISSFHYGDPGGISDDVFIQPHSGFGRCCNTYPHAWSLLIFDSSFKASALLCAAAILPVLAGVKLVGAICIDGIPSPQALLTLELCGIEDIFVVSIAELYVLLDEKCLAGLGSLIVLSKIQEVSEVLNRAQSMDRACADLSANPNILLHDNAGFDPDVLNFCLGFTPVIGKVDKARPVDAIYTGVETSHKLWHDQLYPECPVKPRLYITPGCEGLWLFKNLDTNFFRSRRLLFQFL